MSFRYLTAGESHGRALTGIMEGMPAGLPLSAEDIQIELRRRKLGYGRGARQKIEDDAVEILSGVRHGDTIGSPIALLIQNKDWLSWQEIMQVEKPAELHVKRKVKVPRPGHADLVGALKYGFHDMRNVLERSSARETTMRVALASIARRFLSELGIAIASRVTEIGTTIDASIAMIPVAELNVAVDASPVRVCDPGAAAAMVKTIEAAKKTGETLGGVFEVFASGVPIGLGAFAQWDRRLEAEIGRTFLSLNAIKGVEIGAGFAMAKSPGSQSHDEYLPGKRVGLVRYATNRSGGIDGGMSTGQTIVVRAAMKPLATLMRPLQSVEFATNEPAEAHVERSDVCAVPSAAVIGESLLALTLTQSILEKFGGDSMAEIRPRVTAWRQRNE